MACKVYTGCCGFPFARRRYYEMYRVVEVQQTFYDPPSRETLERWRGEAPAEFIFHVKAWQAVTHTRRSPTWKRIRRSLVGDPDNYGGLRLTEENKWAWMVTLEAAEALDAEFIVVQTPASFAYSGEAAETARRFFEWATDASKGRLIGWEPRGTWHEHPDAVRGVVCSTGVVHIVDLLRREPVVCEGQRVAYTRLHGLGGREVNYRYRYTDEDLLELARRVQRLLDTYGLERVYVMFNNVYMGEDAARFREKARETLGLEVC